MKNVTLISTFLAVFTAFSFLSCETQLEPVDPNIVTPEPSECFEPGSFQASDFINNTDVNLNWIAGDTETAWQIQYGLQGFTLGSGTNINATANHHTVTGLASTNSYQFYVRAVCGGGEFSDWTGPISVGGSVAPCTAPTNLAAVRASDVTKINVSWTAGSGTAWQIQYGNTGFAVGSGTTVTSNAPNQQLAGVLGNQAYDVYVRTVCAGSAYSNWTGPINISAVSGPVSYGFLSANVNGMQYNGLKPFFYPFTGVEARVDALSGKILIQGHSDPLSNPTNNFTEITIKIPAELWSTGTHTLHPTGVEMPAITVDLIMVNATNGWTTYENEIPGTITITNFDTTNLRIQGTFSFTYELGGDSTGGPFNVSNGTFDFPLKAEDWD